MDFKKTIITAWAGFASVAFANSYVVVLSETEYDVKGSMPVVVGERKEAWSEWSDVGSEYDCSSWTPLESTVDWNVSYTQSNSCSQNQKRTQDIYDVYDNGSEKLRETKTENKTVSVSNSQPATGTKKLREMCINILNRGNSIGDGVYQVDPDGDGSVYAPRAAYCDMTGGGWTLYDSFGTKLVKTGLSNPASYNYANINSTSSLTAAHYNYSLMSLNNTYYTVSPYYMQFFYDSEPFGFIQKTMPTWAESVRMDTSNEWYGGSQTISYGSDARSVGGNKGYTKYIFNKSGGEVLRAQENGIVWVDSVWVK